MPPKLKNLSYLHLFFYPFLSKISTSIKIEPDTDSFFRIKNTNFKNEKSLTFNILGDWGGFPEPFENTPIQLSAAKDLAKVSEAKSSKFTLAIGDNFYFNGVKDIYDPRFYSTYEKVYTDPSLRGPWYVNAGNHDWMGNLTAQIKYSDLNQRWTFPDLFYSVKYEFDGGNQELNILMIDTQMLCDQDVSGHNKNYPIEVTYEMREKELLWLDQELQNIERSKSGYTLVVGHYPIQKPSSPNECLIAVESMCKKYNVDAYISGHKHIQAHLVSNDDYGLNHVITGIGSLARVESYEPTNTEAEVKFMFFQLKGWKGGFMTCTVDAAKLVFDWFYADGSLEPQYSVVLKNKSKI